MKAVDKSRGCLGCDMRPVVPAMRGAMCMRGSIPVCCVSDRVASRPGSHQREALGEIGQTENGRDGVTENESDLSDRETESVTESQR